jgi:sugar lactone lactonase YvrE
MRVFRAARAQLAECPVWMADGRLLWVDALAGEVHASGLAAASGPDQVRAYGGIVGSVTPVADGTLVIGRGTQVWLTDGAGALVRLLAEIGHPHPDHHLNDAAADPQGRLLIGSVNERDAGRTAGLFQLTGGGYRKLRGDMRLSNGLDWTPDGGTLYFTDSLDQLIFTADYHDDGSFTGERAFARVAGGLPDGLAVDADGCVWSAVWGAGRIDRYAPDGTITDRVTVPAPHVTSLAFGGDDLTTLFITSARDGLSAQELAAAPGSGSVFMAAASVPGQPVRLIDPAQLPDHRDPDAFAGEASTQ